MSVTCRACGSTHNVEAFPFETSWNEKSFTYRRCTSCGTTCVHPVPTADELTSIYAWSNYHAHHWEAAASLDRYGESLAYLRRQRPSSRTMLDFGCGDGSFLAAARIAGYDVHGIEYEASAIERARARAGAPVTDLATVKANGLRFDVVHMNDVLPHLVEPDQVMRELASLVAPGGALFVEGPLENNASVVMWAASLGKHLRRRAGVDTPATHPPTMLMRFTAEGQRRFFRERLGYRELDFEMFESGWPYFVAGRSLESPTDFMKQAIGRLAVLIGNAQPRSWRVLGNRFRAILDVGEQG